MTEGTQNLRRQKSSVKIYDIRCLAFYIDFLGKRKGEEK